MILHPTTDRATKRVVRTPRSGFTLIELLVVISILAVLMALTLQAVMSARTAAQRAQCQNNLRNLGVAMLNSADAKQRFPASGYFTLKNGAAVESHNWVVDLLGFLDRSDISSKWDFSRPASESPNSNLAKLRLNVLVCPTDISATGQGDLSYVVNGGFGTTTLFGGVADCPVGSDGQPVDFNGNGIACPANVALDGSPGDKEIYFESGMFFLESFRVPGTVRHHTLNDISDGMSQTIMIGENARVGFDPFSPATNWATAQGHRNSFFLPASICFDSKCSPGNVDYARANQGSTGINAGLDLPEGTAFSPNSFHIGGVHFVFADGHVKFISQAIAGTVYAALVSPQGSRIRGPLAQRPVSDNEY